MGDVEMMVESEGRRIIRGPRRQIPFILISRVGIIDFFFSRGSTCVVLEKRGLRPGIEIFAAFSISGSTQSMSWVTLTYNAFPKGRRM